MKSEFRLDDKVLMRFVQIFQEGMLLGVDCADIMRQIRLEVDPDNGDVLVLTSAYKEMVKDQHEKLLAQVATLKSE